MTENGGNIKRGSKAHRENYIFRKRKPTKPEEGENVLYVNRITSIKAQLEKCNKLISENQNEIIIYCMGAAIQRGLLLALQLCQNHVAYCYSANTFSTELIDDLEPAVDNVDYEIQRRFNSALRIRIFRKHSLENTFKSNK